MPARDCGALPAVGSQSKRGRGQSPGGRRAAGGARVGGVFQLVLFVAHSGVKSHTRALSLSLTAAWRSPSASPAGLHPSPEMDSILLTPDAVRESIESIPRPQLIGISLGADDESHTLAKLACVTQAHWVGTDSSCSNHWCNSHRRESDHLFRPRTHEVRSQSKSEAP